MRNDFFAQCAKDICFAIKRTCNGYSYRLYFNCNLTESDGEIIIISFVIEIFLVTLRCRGIPRSARCVYLVFIFTMLIH